MEIKSNGDRVFQSFFNGVNTTSAFSNFHHQRSAAAETLPHAKDPIVLFIAYMRLALHKYKLNQKDMNNVLFEICQEQKTCKCGRNVRLERNLRVSFPEHAQRRERNRGDRARRSERPQKPPGSCLVSV